MSKIVILDGGPRKTMNTAQMIEAFKQGVQSVSDQIEIQHVRLYELDYTGCRSCMACKLKDSKNTDVCAIKDGATEALRDAAYADGLVFASPMYFFQISAQLRAFMERLFFPWLSYVDYSSNPPKGHIPTACIYTMNANAEQCAALQSNNMRENETVIANALGKPDHIEANFTTQVKNYDRYAYAEGTAERKQAYRDAHWEEDLAKAREAGKRMAEKIIKAH